MRKKLLETYGIFEGCEDLAIEIADKIYEKWCQGENTSPEPFTINCSWASRGYIAICPTKQNVRAGYLLDYKQTHNQTIIVVNPLILDWRYENATLGSLMHELTHAYRDCQRRRGNNSEMEGAVRRGYNKTFDYKFRTNEEDRTIIKNDLSTFLYWTDAMEKPAFFAGMYAKVRYSIAEYDDAKDYLEAFKSTREYNEFLNILYLGKLLSSHTTPRKQKEVLDAANELTNYNFTTFDQVRKHIISRSKKLEKTLKTVIPKMVMKMMEYEE